MSRSAQDDRWEWLAMAILGVLFFACFLQPESVYRDPQSMALYFGAPEPGPGWQWPGSWSWSEAPFKYRVLFHGAVDACAYALRLVVSEPLRAYWLALMSVSALCFVFSLVALARLLESVGIPRERRAFGLVLWFLLPPVHQAYVLPTQTKEDFLAYGLFFFGLRAILERRLGHVLLIGLACALTRETLLLLPALYFVAAPAEPVVRRAAPLVLAVTAHLAVRFVMGPSTYDALKLYENLASPGVLLFSLVLALGAGWVGLALHFLPSLRSAVWTVRAAVSLAPSEPPGAGRREQFYALLPFVLLAIVPAHLLLGRIQEIRISALLAPWAVTALLTLGRLGSPLRVVRGRSFWRAVPVFAALVALPELLGVGGLLRRSHAALVPDFSTRGWWLEIYLQLFLFILLISERLASRKRARPHGAQVAARTALTG